MRATVILVTIIFGSLLVSCIAPGEAFKPYRESDAATITDGFTSHGLLTYSNYELFSVDEKRVQKPLAGIPTRRLQPGARKLVIYVSFDRGKGAYEAFVPAVVELKPSTAYVLAGDVVGEGVEVWLVEKATGQRASDKFSASTKRRMDMMIPLIM